MIFQFKDRLAELIKRKGAYALACRDAAKTTTVIEKIDFISEDVTIGKSEMRERSASEKVPIGWRRASTSGTSGAPLIFPQPISALQKEQAFIDRLWQLVGFTNRARVAVLRGVLVPGGVRQAANRLIISCEGWSDEDIIYKYEALRKFNPQFIHCYPSLLERFLRRCRALGIAFPGGVMAVLSGSEECTVEHEKFFFEMLGCKTIAWYGQSEQVVLAVKESNSTYAVVPGYSDVAFIQRQNYLEIVGKSRLNPFFSTHWYRTGDICTSVEIAESSILNCKTIIFHGLQGRSNKQIVLADGTLIPFNHVIFGLHSQAWSAIDRYCFVQSKPGVLIFIYSLSPGAKLSILHSLLHELQTRFPKELSLIDKKMDEIGTIRNAKWKYFFESEQSFNDFANIA